jgi:hypothetical protein
LRKREYPEKWCRRGSVFQHASKMQNFTYTVKANFKIFLDFILCFEMLCLRNNCIVFKDSLTRWRCQLGIWWSQMQFYWKTHSLHDF